MLFGGTKNAVLIVEEWEKHRGFHLLDGGKIDR
jgi:hypothetical protein